jgi:hypothetical protein
MHPIQYPYTLSRDSLYQSWLLCDVLLDLEEDPRLPVVELRQSVSQESAQVRLGSEGEDKPIVFCYGTSESLCVPRVECVCYGKEELGFSGRGEGRIRIRVVLNRSLRRHDVLYHIVSEDTDEIKVVDSPQ